MTPPPSKLGIRESIALESLGGTIREEDAIEMVAGRRIEDTFHKERQVSEKVLEKEEKSQVERHEEDLEEEEDREDHDFDEEDSDRSDPFDSGSESDCLDRGSALSDFTEMADMKVEECRPSDAPMLVLSSPTNAQKTSARNSPNNLQRYKDSKVFHEASSCAGLESESNVLFDYGKHSNDALEHKRVSQKRKKQIMESREFDNLILL